MKLLIRFFLSLCFVLSGGQGDIYAYSHTDHSYHFPVQNLHRSQPEDIGILQNCTCLHIHSPRSATITEHEKVTAEDNVEEDDEDNQIPFKKSLAAAHNITSFLHTSTSAFWDNHTKGYSPFRHFSYSLLFRYILFRVIRI